MSTAPLYAAVETNSERDYFYEQVGRAGAQPLWRLLGDVVAPQPRPLTKPVVWSYDRLRPLLMEAGRLIGTAEAKRRVLLLENPGLMDTRITSSLLAGLQLVLPGEIAPAHRHVASALRLVMEGTGAYTSVRGERTTMHPGDFIVTPSWSFHDHGNFSDDPAVWLDVLDIPTVDFFDAGFAELYSTDVYPVLVKVGDSLARYGENLVPLDYQADAHSTPMFTYPYSRSRDAIERLARDSEPNPCHGIKMQFVNPVNGGYPMPTIAAFIQKLPSGFEGAPYRSTDSTVYVALEGEGHSQIGEESLEWRPNHIFVAPSWRPVSHFARHDSILFSFSDRAAQKALGFWREEVL